jgi:CRISPR-associated protein Csh2
MSFTKRREILFIYSVKDANPNGDPLNANHPRYDQETGQILVSDVRIKRTVRDQWLRGGHTVFIDAEPKTMATRVEELKKELDVESGAEAIQRCLDARLFGVTYAYKKESFSWTGPVQFKWGRSLHQSKPELIQGTGAFATSDDSEQRTFRNEYIVPFVVLGVYGVANQNASETTGATEEDVDALISALWEGTINLITRSKIGHRPELLLEIVYKDGFQGLICALDEKVTLLKDGNSLDIEQQLSLRSLDGIDLDISKITAQISKLEDHIQSVNLRHETGLSILGLDQMEAVLRDRLKITTG